MLLSTQLASADRHRERRFHRDAPIGQSAPATLTAGAIAYSPSTGNVGWSYGQTDQETAKWAAVQACGQADCAWKVSEQGAFAVLVLGGGGIYWAWDYTLAGAQQRALELCSANATGCAVTRWVAS
ncbi:MAG: DUF4189 domain-containing protein [Kofleriaceae bacterium]|nr:DUF4189 domain-containing protein [Kofleriaceae bacterium]